MQPAYLPWCGYLDMIDQADLFVLLDTVAIDRKSWQTRNRILGRDGKAVWLSVPVQAHRGQPLNEVKIAPSQGWRVKHRRTITTAYGHLEHERSLDGIVNLIRWTQIWHLAQFTEAVIRETCRILGITTRIVTASSLNLAPTNEPIQRIAELCKVAGADELLNASGARHLYSDDFPVPIRWHDYDPRPYEQNGGPFISHLSVIDALARLGPESTLDLVRSGRMSSERV
jgi:hypothetical protein